MGAVWFVSRLYCEKIDGTHRNWTSAGSLRTRSANFNNSSEDYIAYLELIKGISNARLGTNTIGLSGDQVKEMVNILLKSSALI